MRQRIISVTAIVLLVMISLFSFAQKDTQLPQKARTLISNHFKGYTVNHVEKDVDILSVEYKVYVGNKKVSFKLEFDGKGSLVAMSSLDKTTQLPKSLIPLKVSQYVTDTYPNSTVVEWEKDRKTQTVELSNGMELVFGQDGRFLRIDD